MFSYGCPACNQFEPIMLRSRRGCRTPSSCTPAVECGGVGRSSSAYLTAQVLGIADKTHEAMYDAIWKTGELAVVDPVTHRLKEPQPTIGLVARFTPAWAASRSRPCSTT